LEEEWKEERRNGKGKHQYYNGHEYEVECRNGGLVRFDFQAAFSEGQLEAGKFRTWGFVRGQVNHGTKENGRKGYEMVKAKRMVQRVVEK